jgi:Tfp pilus assembly protein PilF
MVCCRKRFAVLLLILIASLPSFAGQTPWSEVISPHFRVLTDGPVGNARRVAVYLEQIRFLFSLQFHNFRLDPATPILVLIPADAASLHSLIPQANGRVYAVFLRGSDKTYALIRMDNEPVHYVPHPTFSYKQIFFGGYARTLLRSNSRRLPTWLEEGLGQFYSYTQFDHDKIHIGMSSTNLRYIANRTPLSLEELLRVNYDASYKQNSRQKVREINNEFWILAHFLMFGPGMEHGKHLDEYCVMLQQGAEPIAAFQQKFGDFASIEKQFRSYASQLGFANSEVQVTQQIDEAKFSVRTMSVAETEAELGLYHLRNQHFREARSLIEQALQDEPTLALAHEAMGFLWFHDGNDKEAASQFGKASELDPNLYLSFFFKTMLANYPKTPEGQSALNLALLQAIQTNPSYAPTYVEVAKLDVRKNSLANALTVIRKAEQLEPSRTAYDLLEAQTLMRIGQADAAAPIVQYLATQSGPEHNAAVRLWNSLPASVRPSGNPPNENIAEGTQTMDGTLQVVTCADNSPIQLKLDHEGRIETFVMSNNFSAGFSDSLWYGKDHFNICHHLEGAQVIVRYKPSADKSYAGNLEQLELLEALPNTIPEKPAHSEAENPMRLPLFLGFQ